MCDYPLTNPKSWTKPTCANNPGHGPGKRFCKKHAKRLPPIIGKVWVETYDSTVGGPVFVRRDVIQWRQAYRNGTKRPKRIAIGVNGRSIHDWYATRKEAMRAKLSRAVQTVERQRDTLKRSEEHVRDLEKAFGMKAGGKK